MGDILPPLILISKTRGQQAPDWHENLALSPEAVKDELSRINIKGLEKYIDVSGLPIGQKACRSRDGSPRI